MFALVRKQKSLRQAKSSSVAIGPSLKTVPARLKMSAGAAALNGFRHDCSRRLVDAKAPVNVQAKLMVNAPGDMYEQEADHIADKVMHSVDLQFQYARVSGRERFTPRNEVKQWPIQPLQTKAIAASHVGKLEAPAIGAATLRSPGRPLDPATRRAMESSFGYDFSHVRVHTGGQAAESARHLNARAYTMGRTIVFAAGEYQPKSATGRRLLAHELTHVVQQTAGVAPASIQRQKEFGPAVGAPSDWKTKVSGARTSAEKAALVQTATGIKTIDVTAATKSDIKVNKAHLNAYDSADPKINYDDGLNTKKSIDGTRTLTRNAGYTINSAKSYVVLGPKSLDSSSYYATRRILSHEFDHVRQAAGRSRLKGNESELDAWTSSFIRDFHRSYVLRDNGTICYIQSNPTWNPLLEYYVRKDVSNTVRDDAVKRIKEYYAATIAPHAAHKLVFRYWIHRMLKKAGAKFDDLPVRLNKELRLGIDPAARLSTTRQFSCSAVAKLTYPKAPEVAKP